MFEHLKLWWLLFKWKRRARRHRRPNLHIGNLADFFSELNQKKVSYAVLRWFGEIPLNQDEEGKYHGDLDILLDSKDLMTFAAIVAKHPGNIKIDLYTEGIQMGTAYARLPYFLPPKALEILQNRELYNAAFFVPNPKYHLLSLCYHLTYQKGLLSGLDNGLDETPNTVTSPHDIRGTLSQLADACHEELPQPLTLFALHKWLAEHNWNMPYDLLAIWGKKDEWHDKLQKWMENQLAQACGEMKDIFVFLIRQDALDVHAQDAILAKINEQFTVIDTVYLDEQQKMRVLNQTRGANWMRHKGRELVPPVIAVICHDPEPVPVDPNSKEAQKYKNVRNAHVFFKQKLRDDMKKAFPQASYFLHGSDNDLESTEYMLAVYGKDNFQNARQNVIRTISKQN